MVPSKPVTGQERGITRASNRNSIGGLGQSAGHRDGGCHRWAEYPPLGDSSYRELQTMRRPEINPVPGSKAMPSLARHLTPSHGIPSFQGSFHDMRGTSRTLHNRCE
jgi:hypothetical protein